LLTDISGETTKLTDVKYFHTLESQYGYGVSNLREIGITIDTTPRQDIWINVSQIDIAVVENVRKGVAVSLTLLNHEKLTGMLRQKFMNIRGLHSNEEKEYAITEIKTLKFIHSKLSTQGNTNFKNRKKWKVIDGNMTNIRKGLYFIDCYATDVKGLFRYAREFRDERWRYSIDVGNEEDGLSLDGIRYFEVTGKQIDNRPEVIIVRENGNKFSGPLGMWTSCRGDCETGMFDIDDLMVWYEPYGRKGVSLLPLRHIRFELIK
jgi:hypothetical protein